MDAVQGDRPSSESILTREGLTGKISELGQAIPQEVQEARARLKQAEQKAAFLAALNGIRRSIKDLAFDLQRIQLGFPFVGSNPGEAQENLMLAYRHIEDASMRVGKAIQATDGGVSVYEELVPVGA